jgi:hypothetical protein
VAISGTTVWRLFLEVLRFPLAESSGQKEQVLSNCVLDPLTTVLVSCIIFPTLWFVPNNNLVPSLFYFYKSTVNILLVDSWYSLPRIIYLPTFHVFCSVHGTLPYNYLSTFCLS